MADEHENSQERQHAQEPDEAPALDWSSAQVTDGTLTVPLSGDPSEPWRGVFERTVKLLGGGDWEDVELESSNVRVTGVSEGVEGSLRQFLEGAVQEANATVAPDEDQAHRSDDDETHGDAEGNGDDGDARMTERFRDFGS